MKNNKPAKKAVKAAFKEVYSKKPAIVKKTEAKKGKAAGKAQMIAIALSKARAKKKK